MRPRPRPRPAAAAAGRRLAVEARLVAALAGHLCACAAPAEQFTRMGLPAEAGGERRAVSLLVPAKTLAADPHPTAAAGRIRPAPRVAILAAMREEIDAFRRTYAVVPATQAPQFPADRFWLGGVEVTLMRSGVGKVLAAMVAQQLIDRVRPDYLIVTGIAGAVRPDLELGDVVVSRDCVQHDFDATPLGFELGQIPYTDYRFLAADPKLIELALATPVAGQRVVAGRILTGDQFIKDPDPAVRERLRTLDGSVVEMEGAAIALVATVHRIPFVIIRAVSDRADATAPADFGAYLRRAAANSHTVCAGILEHLAGDQPDR